MIKYYDSVEQGSDEWYALRCGVLTASEMKLIITPTFKAANSEKERSHLYELLAQRVTRYVEPQYVSDDMLRGKEDEIYARELYAKHYHPIKEVGFVTNTLMGVTIGYSPDALVGDDGQIEIKSRRQKYQTETILEYSEGDKCPDDYLIQVQTGLLVTQRKWCDFITYCGGMPMTTIRVYPDPKVQNAILEVAIEFENRLLKKLHQYNELRKSAKVRMIPTERRVEQEIVV